MNDAELAFPDDDRLPKPLRELWDELLAAIEVKGTILEVTNRGFVFVAKREHQSREFLFTPRTLRDLFLETDQGPENRVMPQWWFLANFDEFVDFAGEEPYESPYVIVQGFGEFFPSLDGIHPYEYDKATAKARIEAELAETRARVEAMRKAAPLWRRIAHRKQTGWFAANAPEEAQRIREAKRSAQQEEEQ
ncbi:hypothetical protein ACFFOS_27760 [Nocardioides kongjuensis]|uniref:Uncharacterized protein n=1 Tax=Nocardioides kongjuensis TaxID=349522 RepID=A0A852RCH3_9ACTN|nr:hypothetical protein [Nocardioides kongjuensis]NYD32693.1 hypothetical protein [Nocardioides kongjuensis]